MLDIFISLLRRKKHHAPNNASGDAAPADAARGTRQSMLQKLNSELRDLRASVTDKNVEQKTSEFYALTKKALKEILSIKYEATFQEITEELEKKKHYSTKLREDLAAFLEDVSVMEYGYAHFEELLEDKRREQEKNLMGYIKELERDGEKVGKKTKSRIASIVSDSVPHSNREYLVRMMDDFKSIAHQL
ncbi:MAG: hypothetical protein NT051_04430 [Candidatus Micrarchaeota archaeon]|nr:hypothetical protein [Candidatus Micrarchaeota archaeon]